MIWVTGIFCQKHVFFPNQACLKGFLLSLIRNAFMWCGRAVPPSRQPVPPALGRWFPQSLDPSSPQSVAKIAFGSLKPLQRAKSVTKHALGGSNCKKESQKNALGSLKSLERANGVPQKLLLAV